RSALREPGPRGAAIGPAFAFSTAVLLWERERTYNRPARAGHGRGGAPGRSVFPSCTRALRLALATGEVARRAGGLFCLPPIRGSFLGNPGNAAMMTGSW